jgi:hypothetical protein
VVYNLFENAVKFTNPGGYIEIHVEDSSDRTTVTVRNSGHGIETEEIGMIFDRFYKTDKSRSHDKNGMGLGLYIVKTMIHLHGGEISVSSVVDDYTQFSFWLPKTAEAPKLKEGALPGQKKEPPKKAKKQPSGKQPPAKKKNANRKKQPRTPGAGAPQTGAPTEEAGLAQERNDTV